MDYPRLKQIIKADEETPARTPIKRVATIHVTYVEAAKLTGHKDWTGLNEYLDADYGDVYSADYTAHDVRDLEVKGLPSVQLVFGTEVAVALQSTEHTAMVDALGQFRRNYLEKYFDGIYLHKPSYTTADGEVIHLDTPAKIVSVQHQDGLTLDIHNPEHLINVIIEGASYVTPYLNPYEAASDEQIKKELFEWAPDFFNVFGNKPNDEPDDYWLQRQTEKNFDPSTLRDEVTFRIEELDEQEIITKIVDAFEDGEVDPEDLAKLAVEFLPVSSVEEFNQIPEVKREFNRRLKQEKRKRKQNLPDRE